MKYMLLLICLLALPGFALSEAVNSWGISAESKKKLFRGKLVCTTPPTAGGFQSCQIELTDQRGNPIKKAHIKVTGGMPSHGHGLPTSPKAEPAEQHGRYVIKGLKYNMSGDWVLDLKIQVYNLVDLLTFNLNVKY